MDFRFDNPDEYVKGTPHHAFAWLRAHAPFAWHLTSPDARDGFWLATKHKDVTAISKNLKVFATHAPLLADPLPRALWPQFPALAMIADNLMTFDDRKHAAFRPLANWLFSQGRLSELESSVRAICVDRLARVAGRASFDFADDVALAIPVDVILGAFLGVPREDLPSVTRAVLTINAMDDPAFRSRREALPEAAEELCQYGRSLLRRVSAAPTDSVLSDIVHQASIDGVSTDDLFFAYWFPLAAGAFDTTASTIAGGVHALLQCPDQLTRLREDAAIVPLAVEEMLRWVSPVIYFRRTALADTDHGGHRIMKGQKVVLCYASANRDEDIFRDANTFDVTRTPNSHVSFGYGPHFCLGARLASFVLRIFLEEFRQHLADIQMAGDVIHTRSAWMNRIRSMPVQRRRRPSSHGP